MAPLFITKEVIMAIGDPTLYKKYLGGHNWITHVDHGALKFLKDTFEISTMLDIGCGPGDQVRTAINLGISAQGVDGDVRVINENKDITIHECDYTLSSFEKDVDLIWSTEFVEHVEEMYQTNYMNTFARAKHVFITFAPPGKSGNHHVNLKSKEYWIEIFSKYGLKYDEKITQQIKDASTMQREFVKENGLYFRRVEERKILLVASGLSAKQFYDYDYKNNGWIIIAVNNGWLSCSNEWDYWIKSNDFDGSVPAPTKTQTIVNEYGKSLLKFGGQKECGFSITLNAGYWVLANLNPSIIAFLGADMNYTPDKEGNTHIYGLGNDIRKNGIPDPDRMVNIYGKNDENYLENIYLRLNTFAEKQNCKIFNVSRDIESRLPYKRILPSLL